MGRAAQKSARFLAEHSACCFCAGDRKATTIDHVPSRALFDGRVWPEGFEFPACPQCNAVTSKDEMIAAVICRAGRLNANEIQSAHTLQLLRGVHNNFPGLLNAMVEREVDRSRFLQERGVRLPEGLGDDDFALFSVDDPRVQDAMRQFGRKLLLALFYRHTKTVFPRQGQIAFRWFSNANFSDIHPIVRRVTPQLAETRRANTSLGDQFYYQYGVANTNRAAAFISFFNDSAAILGMLFSYEPQVAIHVGGMLTAFD